MRDSLARWLRLEEAIGVDFGSHTLKVAHVENVAGILRLTQLASAPMPPRAMESGMVVDPEGVAAALRHLIAQSGITSQQAIAAVSGPSMVARTVRMPLMRDAQLERAVRVQAEEFVPFNLDDSIIEHCVLRRETAGAMAGMEVAIVVVPVALAESRVAALERAGLEPIVIDVEPFAELCSLVELSTESQLREETLALINLGASVSTMTIVLNGRLAVTRALTFGGESLTRAIAAATRCPETEAEVIKKAAVAVGVEEVQPPQCEAPEASLAMAPLLDSLARQIEQTVTSLRSQGGGSGRGDLGPLDRVLLTGGSSQLTGLPRFLEEHIGAPVSVASLLRENGLDCPGHLSPRLMSDSPLFSVALGLTLREHVRRGRHAWLVAA